MFKRSDFSNNRVILVLHERRSFVTSTILYFNSPLNCSYLQSDLENLDAWSLSSRMVLDVSKYHVIRYSSTYSLAVSHYSLSDSAVFPVQVTSDLAVYSDSRLTFSLSTLKISEIHPQEP